ncbi:hypothetical protein CSUB01_10906 [Colletotrichum sublineola]|uniref:BZIP domain-containing protein n=1 Tax=Colletotrichum sublineola TaxID=1173701 RepID=A0A066XQV7_COLSU|nr:hypothetical protein CSUB01_10906 [Colletotrichum sublineola]
MKGAQRQRDAILEALVTPGQTHDVLHQLRNGETLDRIYENLEMHGSASPTTSQVSDTSSQLQHIKEDSYSTPSQIRLCPPRFLNLSYSAGSEGPETSHLYRTIKNQESPLNCAKDKPDGLMPHLQTSIFSNTTPENSIYGHDAVDSAPSMPFGMFMEQNASLILPDAHRPNQTYPTDDVGNMGWWHSGIPDPMQPSYIVPPFTNPNAWPSPQFIAPHHPSQAQDSYSQPSSTLSPVSDKSPLISCLSSPEKVRDNVASGITTVDESSYPTPPPTKKRKLPTKEQVSSAASDTGSRGKSNGFALQESMADNKPSDKELPSHNRERHRRASARNWQKQKKQMTDLQEAMKFAEYRNRELRREYAEVLSQVIHVKNALMDHAKCNDPAISSWLCSQATNYVLKRGAAAEEQEKNQLSTGEQGAPTYTAGRKTTTFK